MLTDKYSKIIRLIFITINLLIFASNEIVICKEVPVKTAEGVAIKIFYERNHFTTSINYNDIMIDNVYTAVNDTTKIYYVFNISLKNRQEKGFVIVSAEDKVHPVLGYSFEGNYPTLIANQQQHISPEFEYWINKYKQQIMRVRSSEFGVQSSANNEIKGEWARYTKSASDKSDLISKSTTVGPFITTQWGQDCFYNALCPYDSKSGYGYCSHVPTGCEATAMAQILRYWTYPISGSGGKSDTNSYGVLSADFSSLYFAWKEMPEVVIGSDSTTQKNAISNLMLDCGISVAMQYNINGSTAYSSDIPTALTKYFNYSASANLVSRSNYMDIDWENLIKGQLDANMPVIYCGQDPIEGGHAFICDGYESNDYFHINWGWDGSYDGYFLLSDLAPDDQGNFSTEEQAVINIYPGEKIQGLSKVHAYQQNCTYSLNYYYPYDINWTVTGGDIVSGQGTENIIVNWFQEGSGQVNLKLYFDKSSGQDKNFTFTQNIIINSDTIYLYPEANHAVQLNVNSVANGNMVVNIYSVLGKMLETMTYKKYTTSFNSTLILPNIQSEIVIVEILFNNKKLVRKIAMIN